MALIFPQLDVSISPGDWFRVNFNTIEGDMGMGDEPRDGGLIYIDDDNIPVVYETGYNKYNISPCWIRSGALVRVLPRSPARSVTE